MKEQVKYQPHIVAFIDILGYSNIIADANEQSAIKAIVRFITIFDKTRNEFLKHVSWEKDKFSLKMFSDCICISIPADILNVDAFFKSLAFIQSEFARNEMLLRGAITIGNHFESEDIIFSQALLDAYRIESKVSIYPRIVVTQQLKDFIFSNGTEEDIIWFTTAYCWKNDVDKFIFVDYLNFMPFDKRNEFHHNGKDLLNHKSFVEKNLVLYGENENIYTKFEWIANYHNSFCQTEYPDKQHLLIEGVFKARQMSNRI